MAEFKALKQAVTRVEMKIDDIQEELKTTSDRKEQKRLKAELKQLQEDPKFLAQRKELEEMEAQEAKKAASEAAMKKTAAPDAKAKPGKAGARKSVDATPVAVVDATPEAVLELVKKTIAAGEKDEEPARLLRTTALALGADKVLALDLDAILDASLASKDLAEKVGVLRCLKALAWVSPLVAPKMDKVVALFGDAKAAKAAVDTAMSMVKDISVPAAIPALFVPAIKAASMDKKKWKIQAAAMEVLALMTERMSEAGLMKQLANLLADIIPLCVEASREIRKEVQAAALNVLNSVGRCIANPEIKRLGDGVIKALANPTNQKLTQDVLMDLGSTTFMNYVDANALALLIPILSRAMREREQKSRKWATQIFGSCVKLVKDVEYLVPYLSEFMPLLKNTLMDPTPEVQRESAKSFGQLSVALPEQHKNEFLPFLQSLAAAKEEVERQGAAHAMAHCYFVAGKDSLPELLGVAYSQVNAADAGLRHSYFEVLDIVSGLFKEDYAPHLPQSLAKALAGCGDKDEIARAAALRAASGMMNFFGPLCPDACMPILRDAYLTTEDATVRCTIVKQIEVLVAKILENKQYGQDLLTTQCGSESMRKELAALVFFGWKSDSDATCVRAFANPWKIATVPPKTMGELLPSFQSLFKGLKEADETKFAKAIKKASEALVASKVCSNEDLEADFDGPASKVLREMSFAVKDVKSSGESSSKSDTANDSHEFSKQVEAAKAAYGAAAKGVPAAVAVFAEAVAVAILLEAPKKKVARKDLEAALSKIVPSLTAEAFDEMVATMFANEVEEEDNGDGEEICRVENLMLMYGGGKLLLKDTMLRMCRGHRYGIVGHNGAGKTTLMKQLAAGNVANMPKNVKCVHVSDAELGDLKVLEMNAVEFVKRDAPEGVDIDKALEDVNYPRDMQDKLVSDLSGGWRMRLILARAMMKNADIILLDEPTNHLDVQAIAWLEQYLVKQKDSTMMIISHEAKFLNVVCTDVMQYKDQKLHYYRGNFDAFQEQIGLKSEDVEALLKGDLNLDTPEEGAEEGAVKVEAVASKAKLTFPIPGKLAGISSSSKGVMTMKNVNFAYDMNKGLNLKDVNVKLALNSRVAIVGRNGAGKSTLMGLLCRELNPTEIEGQTGEVWRHHNLRLAFIAQHHMETLGKFYKCTPFQYMQHRFQNGWDEELQKHLIEPKDEEEALLRKELAKEHGKYGLQIGNVVGRTQKGKQLLYEVQWDGISDTRQNTWEPLEKFRAMGVEKFAIACDERIQAMAAGNDQRPLSRREVVKHLEQFGIDEEMCCNREIGSFSAGQKSKMALGAVFWTRPHLVALDEPTNYLDPETVSALARALKWFRGGVVVITHHQGFIDEVCNEAWRVADGVCTIEKLENDNKRVA